MILRILIILLLFASSAFAEQIYLSPVEGDGSDDNPFHSRCLRLPGGGNIDLRPDPTKAAGYMLCTSTDLPANRTGLISIGTDRTSAITPQVKTALDTTIGTRLRVDTVEDVVKQIVIPRLPQPKSGVYEIILGKKNPRIRVLATLANDIKYKGFAVAMAERGMKVVDGVVASLKVPLAWAASATEDFNCANHASVLTCDLTWTNITGTWQINTNQALRNTTGTARIRAEALMDTDDYEVQATLIDLTVTGTGNGICSLMARKSSDATTTNYAFGANDDGSAPGYQIDEVNAGTRTTQDTDTQDPVDNDLVKIRVVGANVLGFVNGVEIAAYTDGTPITGNRYGGFYATATVTTFSCTWDNWSIADYTAPTTLFGPLRRRM